MAAAASTELQPKTGKKFFDRFRNQSTGQKSEHETKELLSAENFTAAEICRHGFPHRPTCLAFDPVQRLLAVGTENGSIRILGRPGVDFYLKHESRSAVIKLQFLINEGAFISLCHDDCVHLWTIRQKRPEIVHSLQFRKEKLTTMHLPFQSKWLYLGTDKGNVHVVSVESFQLSGYVIAWNKAIDLSQRTHPGSIVHLSDCPTDDSKLLIGFKQGSMVLWDLKLRQVEARFNCEKVLRSVSWHYEGKQFISGHLDGSLITWSPKRPQEPSQFSYPHSSKGINSNSPGLRPIGDVEWQQQKDGDDYVVFSGGTSLLEGDSKDATCLSIVKNKSTVSVVEMEHKIISFVLLFESPFCRDAQDPYAICVLLKNDLVMVDLLSRGYPCFENPHPMDIHESPVTCCLYAADCPTDLIPAFYAVGSKQKRQGYTDKTWPVKGGECGVSPFSYPEILITGHSDGSLKFWDATAVNLQVLYKLKTSKFLEKSTDILSVSADVDLQAVQKIVFCQESRQLLVSFDGGHLILFKFSRRDSSIEISGLTIPIPLSKNDIEQTDTEPKAIETQRQPGLKRQRSLGSLSSSSSLNTLDLSHPIQPLKVRGGQQKLSVGYHPDLICLIPWQNAQTPTAIVSLALNSSFGLLAYGTDKSLTIVNCKQKACILNISVSDLAFRSTDSSGRHLQKNNSSDSDYIHSSKDKIEPIQHSSDFDNTLLSSETIHNMFQKCSIKSQPVPMPISHSPLAPISSLEDEGLSPPHLMMTKSDVSDFMRIRTGTNVMRRHKSPKINPRRLIKRQESAPDVLKMEPTIETPVPPVRVKRKAKKEASAPIQNIQKSSTSQYKLSSSPDLTVPDASSPKLTSKFHEARKNSLITSIFSRNERIPSTSGSSSVYAYVPGSSENTPCGTPTYSRDAFYNKGGPIDMAAIKNLARKFSGKKRKHTLERENSNRTRSSSNSSQENLRSTSDGVRFLIFMESFLKKTEYFGPCLWVGTSRGVVFAVSLKVSNDQPTSAAVSGVHFRPKNGAVLSIGILDHMGNLLLPPAECFKESSKEEKSVRNRVMTKARICSMPTVADAPIEGTNNDSAKQWLVACCEKQIEVYLLMSSSRLYFQRFDSPLVRADIVTLDNGPFIAGYFSSGRVVAYSLPSLRLLLDTNFLPPDDVRINRTIQFSHRGHGLYMCSPSEIQKFTLSTEIASKMGDLSGELFQPCNLPEQPKPNFLKGLIGAVNAKSLDREELFGHLSGRPLNSMAVVIPNNKNLEQLRGQSGGTMNAVVAARLALNERQEKLSEVEDRTALMNEAAASMSSHATELMNVQKNKKWYQL